LVLLGLTLKNTIINAFEGKTGGRGLRGFDSRGLLTPTLPLVYLKLAFS